VELPEEYLRNFVEEYAAVTGRGIIHHLEQLAKPLKGIKVVHVNSSREGGGVSEILQKLVPFQQALGLDARWEVMTGDAPFYQCTKSIHNALQGSSIDISEDLLDDYRRANRENAERLGTLLEEADFVFIHDPQPAALIEHFPLRRGKWVWRCHIDVSHPHKPVWKFLQNWVARYDASIFSLPEFAQPLPHPLYIIPPGIDPLSEKNRDLPAEEVAGIIPLFGLDPNLPVVLQVSRFDRFKDPLGVIEAYRLARKLTPLQLVLAGGSAGDDPEGEAVLAEVRRHVEEDPHIHVLLLPPSAHRTINALQRAADIVLQKSLREGFGLTVAEAMWKGKPVIGGDTGGIRLQVVDHYTGFLVRTPDGAALRIRYLLHRRDRLSEMGERARRFTLENYLLTRHLREYLALMVSLVHGSRGRIEVAG